MKTATTRKCPRTPCLHTRWPLGGRASSSRSSHPPHCWMSPILVQGQSRSLRAFQEQSSHSNVPSVPVWGTGRKEAPSSLRCAELAWCKCSVPGSGSRGAWDPAGENNESRAKTEDAELKGPWEHRRRKTAGPASVG